MRNTDEQEPEDKHMLEVCVQYSKSTWKQYKEIVLDTGLGYYSLCTFFTRRSSKEGKQNLLI